MFHPISEQRFRELFAYIGLMHYSSPAAGSSLIQDVTEYYIN